MRGHDFVVFRDFTVATETFDDVVDDLVQNGTMFANGDPLEEVEGLPREGDEQAAGTVSGGVSVGRHLRSRMRANRPNL